MNTEDLEANQKWPQFQAAPDGAEAARNEGENLKEEQKDYLDYDNTFPCPSLRSQQPSQALINTSSPNSLATPSILESEQPIKGEFASVEIPEEAGQPL